MSAQGAQWADVKFALQQAVLYSKNKTWGEVHGPLEFGTLLATNTAPPNDRSGAKEQKEAACDI